MSDRAGMPRSYDEDISREPGDYDGMTDEDVRADIAWQSGEPASFWCGDPAHAGLHQSAGEATACYAATEPGPEGTPAELQCCGQWIAYPVPGQPSRCESCGSTFTVAGS